MQGHSKLRNRTIANVLSQIGFVEAWGTGILRIQSAAKEYGLPDPEFIETPEAFRVNLFRQPLPTASNDFSGSGGDVAVNGGDIEQIILNSIVADCKISTTEIAETTSIAKRTVERCIKELREEGKLVRHGSARGGYWEVVK